MGIDGNIRIHMKFKSENAANKFKNELEESFKKSTINEVWLNSITLKTTGCYCELSNDYDRNLITQECLLKDFITTNGFTIEDKGVFSTLAVKLNCVIEIWSMYDSFVAGTHHTIINNLGHKVFSQDLDFDCEYDIVDSIYGNCTLDKINID